MESKIVSVYDDYNHGDGKAKVWNAETGEELLAVRQGFLAAIKIDLFFN